MSDLEERLDEVGGSVPKGIMAPAGNRFILVWHDEDDDGAFQVRAQFFGRDGAAQGEPFLIQEDADSKQQLPTVTTLASGNFVVVWVSESEDGTRDVRAQIFKPDGQPVGDEILIAGTIDGGVQQPDVDLLGSGGFVVTWRGHGALPAVPGIKAQIIGAEGQKIGEPFLVNDPSAPDDGPPADLDGTEFFRLTWTDGTVVKGQIFDFQGNRVGGTFIVSQGVPGDDEPAYRDDIAGGFGRGVDPLNNQPEEEEEEEGEDDSDSASASASAMAISAEGDSGDALPDADDLLPPSEAGTPADPDFVVPPELRDALRDLAGEVEPGIDQAVFLVDNGQSPALYVDPNGYNGG